MLLFILVLILIRGTWSVYQKARISSNKVNEISAKVQALEKKEKDLTESIKNLNTPRGVEEEIRSKFSVVKEGERAIVIVNNQEKEDPDAGESAGGFWSRIADFFLAPFH